MALNDSTDPSTGGTGGSGSTPSGSQYTPIPGHPGMYYDPATGAVYGNSGGSGGYVPGGDYPVPGMTYDPTTGNLTNNGSTYTPSNPTPTQPAGGWTPTPATGTTPAPTGGGGGTGGGLPNPFGVAPFQAPPWINLPDVPTFTPPNYTPPPAFDYPAFQAPTLQDALNEPGGQFAIQQGLGAISNSAAAQGLWGTGATGKAMLDYGRNAGNQLYSDIYNRDLNTYTTNAGQAMNKYATNVQTQYLEPYQIAFQNAQAAFAPQMTGYQTQANAISNENALNLNAALQAWEALFGQKLNSAQFLKGIYTQ